MCAGGQKSASSMAPPAPVGGPVGGGSNPYWNADNPSMYRGKDYTYEQMVPNKDYNPSNDPNLTSAVNWQAKPEFVDRGPNRIANPNYDAAYDPNLTGKVNFDQRGIKEIDGPTTETVPNPNYNSSDTRGIQWGNSSTINRPVAWPYGQKPQKTLAPAEFTRQPGKTPDRVLFRT